MFLDFFNTRTHTHTHYPRELPFFPTFQYVFISCIYICMYIHIVSYISNPIEQCSKPRLVGLYRGLYYPVIPGYKGRDFDKPSQGSLLTNQYNGM